MIRPVNLVMAVHTGLSEQQVRWIILRQPALVLGQAWMTGLGMAALAKHGCPHAQHARQIRPMRVMAVIAVFRHRRVFPKERAPEFGVALVTGTVRCHSTERIFRATAVWVVAARTLHFVLANGMRIGFHRLGSLLLVAIEADIRLGRCRQNRIALDVQGMAIGASDCIVVVRTAVPGEAGIAEVALDAILVLVLYLSRRVRGECRNRRTLLATPDAARVVTTRSVASLALQLPVSKRGVWILWDSMPGLEHREGRLVVVTLETRIGTFSAVTRRGYLFLSSLRRRDPG